MVNRSLFLFLLVCINIKALGQVQSARIFPASGNICKGQSIQFSTTLYRGSFQFIGSFDGKDYFMDTVSRSWSDARTAAQSIGMDLWVIDSIQENNAVHGMIPLKNQPNTFFWFGLFQDAELEKAGTSASGWKWIDGRSLDTTFRYWYNSPPFIEPDDVFQSSTAANYAAIGLNNAGSRWSDITNTFSNVFNGYAIAEVNKSALTLEWSTGATNTGVTSSTPLVDQSYFLDITYGGIKVRSNTAFVTVNQPKATAKFLISTNSDTCLYSNKVMFENISVSTDPSNTQYEWNFGDGNKSNEFTVIHQYGGAQSYKAILTARDINGCETFASRQVTINPSPLIPVIIFPNGGNIFCSGDSVTLDNVVVQPNSVTFSWYLDGVFVMNGNSLVAKKAGNYLLKATNRFGCSSSDSTKVTVNTLPLKPVLSIVNGYSDLVCQSDSSLLQSSTAVNVNNYSWFTGSDNGLLQMTNAVSRNLIVTGPLLMGNSINYKDYYVKSVDDNGCKSPISDALRIFFKPSPTITLSAVGGKTTFCEGDSTKLIVDSKATGNTYRWKYDITDLPTIDSIHIASVTGSYFVEVKNSFGCARISNKVNVLVNKIPLIPTIIPGSIDGEILPDGTINICTGSNLNLRTSNVIGALYQWFKNGTAMFPPGINSSVIVNSEASYKVVVNSNGCLAPSAEVKVGLLPLPSGILEPTATNSICDGYTVKLNASGAFGYQWYFENNKLIGETQASYNASGPGLFKVEFFTDKGCKKMSSNFINLVTVKRPKSLFSYSLYCVNTSSSFTNKSESSNSGSVKYLWRFQNGSVDTNFNSTHVFPKAGDYRVVLNVIPNDCPQLADSAIVSVKVENPPVGITYRAINAIVGKPLSLVARSIGDSYEWKPTTGLNSAFIRLPILNPTTEQLYAVKITNRAGCNFVDSQLVRIFDESDIFVAEGFTPNRDGQNDRLYPIPVGVSVFYSFKIFNRWGNLVFESSSVDPALGWDGTYKGKDQPADTYTWVVYGVAQSGKPISKSGSVILIR